MDGVASLVKKLDIHPKVAKDSVVRTKSGAIISLISILLASLLFLSEWRDYRSKEKLEYMEVDPIRNMQMRINFDITFPSMPCAAVSIDAMDASGHNTMDIMHDVFKRRLDKAGNPIGHSERDSMNRVSKEDLLKEKQRAIAGGKRVPNAPATKCGDCYGAGAPNQCCNTCEDVRAAYRIKGWQFNAKTVDQCQEEGYAGDLAAQITAQEGCNVFGHVEVPKVAGNIHFAPGQGVQQPFGHVHDLSDMPPAGMNISHKINSMSFGAYFPGASNILDDLTRTIESGTGMHQYFIKLVPTIYKPLTGSELDSFQFSVTEHRRAIDPAVLNTENGQGLLPGVFFNYELSPIWARIEEKRRSLLHFLTRVCAILGGVFMAMGFVDGLVYMLMGNKDKRAGGMLGGIMFGH